MMRLAVVDYGVGNLHSLAKALGAAGARVRIEADPLAALNADGMVLPGVGAFTPAAERLAPGREALRQALATGFPCLGICLGMQLLFEGSAEGPGAGLGVLPGRVRPLRTSRRPQIGWNTLDAVAEPALVAPGLAIAYYANGFVAEPADPSLVVAWTTHESDRFPAAVRAGNILGVQFHPEKSSAPGLGFLRSWVASRGTR